MSNTLIQTFPRLSASNIVVKEETSTLEADAREVETLTERWVATYEGSSFVITNSVMFDGPEVNMSRVGRTADEALNALVAAAEEQGWSWG